MDYHSALRMNEVLTQAAVWVHLQNLTRTERRHYLRARVACIHLCKMSRLGKSKETAGRLAVANLTGQGEGCTGSGQGAGFPFRAMEMFWN